MGHKDGKIAGSTSPKWEPTGNGEEILAQAMIACENGVTAAQRAKIGELAPHVRRALQGRRSGDKRYNLCTAVGTKRDALVSNGRTHVEVHELIRQMEVYANSA